MDRFVRRGAGLALSAALASASLAGFALAPASAATPDPEVASGSNFTVERSAGGYLVTVELAKPLEIKSDAPTVVVDGASVGIATESADGRSLSVFTTDPSVAKADEVSAGWASQPVTSSSSTATETPVEVPDEARAAALDADPTSRGDYDWTESVYAFGDQAVPLAGIGGIRGELEGKLYLPTTGGARPTVILLHGRHTSCYGTGPSNPLRWPCAISPDNTDRKSIPSYAGYDGTARALASNGYSVVSISANAINSNDNQLAADQGAQARGQLILDTLTMLKNATEGKPVAYDDAWTDRTVSLEQALTDGAASYAARSDGFVGGAPPLDAVTASDLVGKFDLSTIGLMGHSRGGEGVTSAATLNQGLANPWNIESILPLAPVDFGRMSVPDVPMTVMLPYCDGDVSNQQGQHMLDDSRYAFGDDVLRSGVWVMGANHNFFNTVWTPGKYLNSVSDDWSGSTARRTEPTCGTDPTVAATSIRLTADEQYDVGTAYMAGWFRLTLGGEKQFLPMFDGSDEVPAVLGDADVRSVSTAPSSTRSTIASFEQADSLVRTFGTATAQPCASLSGRTTPQSLPACSTTLASAQVPYWTPASNGTNVPATPMTRMSWTSSTGQVRVSVPRAERDASDDERLSVKMAADETVTTGTDLTLSVVDGQGATWNGLVSQLNPLALVRFPTSASSAATTTLKKIVLQQVDVPISTLGAAGLDTSDLREVRFTAAVGADGTATGAAYLSDLALESSSVGTAVVKPEPVVDVYAPNRAEGNGPDVTDVAAYLEAPATTPVTGYVSVLGSTSSRAGATMEKVVFAPGETCKPVAAAVQGDTLPSANAGSTVKASIINTAGAVMGKQAIVFTTVSEDDGITDATVAPLPAYGTPGAVCDELSGVLAGGSITTPSSATPGAEAVVTAPGFRAGESVTFTGAGLTPVTVIADDAGLATATLAVPVDAQRAPIGLTAVGAGTSRTSTGTLVVKDVSSTTLSLDPEVPQLREPVTLTATVTGGDGTVEFFDGTTSLGTAPTASGVATLGVPGFGAGSHSLTAVYGGSETALGSTSSAVSFTLDRRMTTAVLSLSAASNVFGTPVRATVAVDGVETGEVELTFGDETVSVPVDSDGRVVYDLPALLDAGSYTVTAQYTGSDDSMESALATADYQVLAKSTSTVVRSANRVDKNRTFPVRVVVGGLVAGAPGEGVVTLTGRGAGRTVERTAPVTEAGVVIFNVRAPRTGKTFRLVATYTASETGNYADSASLTRVVRLRR